MPQFPPLHSGSNDILLTSSFFDKIRVYKAPHGSSLVAQMVKHLPTMQETWDQSLGWEDPLEKEMENYSRTLAWKTPWTEEPGRLSP